jgi:hypothetical protein
VPQGIWLSSRTIRAGEKDRHVEGKGKKMRLVFFGGIGKQASLLCRDRACDHPTSVMSFSVSEKFKE